MTRCVFDMLYVGDDVFNYLGYLCVKIKRRVFSVSGCRALLDGILCLRTPRRDLNFSVRDLNFSVESCVARVRVNIWAGFYGLHDCSTQNFTKNGIMASVRRSNRQ